MQSLTTYFYHFVGGNGFLGQHLVRELQLRDSSVSEIRVLDAVPFSNKLEYCGTKVIVSFEADLRFPESCRDAFQNVDCVFHCAALVSYEYPPDEDLLYQHNVQGTKNVIKLCIEENVKYLVFTSTAESVLQRYMKSTMAIVIYKTEAKAEPPEASDDFLIPGYPTFKLKAEKVVLEANNSQLSNGGLLKTVSLRPTLLYGEADQGIFLHALQLAQYCDNKIIKFFGTDSKQQVTYAGNAAWAHVLAKNTLVGNSHKIEGLPIFITDDTTIQDNRTFLEDLSQKELIISNWWLPAIVAYLIAAFIELFVRYISFPFFKTRLSYSLTSVASYFSSFILFSRLRASIHLDYSPIYTEEISLSKSCRYYSKQLRFSKGCNSNLTKFDENNNNHASDLKLQNCT